MSINEPKFLDLKSYRRKRLVDAAKMLPVLGVILVAFALPFLYSGSGDNLRPPLSATPLALYFFGVWLALIVVGMILSRVLGRRAGEG